jgi:histidyl-tRNA synthetase
MIAAKQNELRKPIRWFTIPNIWRYEQPQRGRKREFYQWNIDILGVESMDADAEVVAVTVDVLKALGLEKGDFVVRINNRYYLEELLKNLKIDLSLEPSIYREIDRLEKLKPEVFKANLEQVGLDSATIEQLETALRKRNFGDFKPLRDLWERLEQYGIADYVEFDPSIVRGLLYYTGTVFEVWDPTKRFRRAIMGGGRYDNLITALGGQPLPGVGIACSDVTLEEMLEQLGKLPKLVRTLDAFVVHYSPAERPAAIKVASQVRAVGLTTELSLSDVSLDKQLKAASNSGAHFAIIVAPDELERGEVNVKNLQTRQQQTVRLEELATTLKGQA